MDTESRNTKATCFTETDLTKHHGELMDIVAKAKDWAAFEELFEYFGPRVKAMMLKAGADNALAEDLVQETMTKVWRKARLYSVARGSVSTWIFTIARNARIDRLRRASSQPYEEIDGVELTSSDPGPDDELFSRQRVFIVAEAVHDLPDEQREVIELAFMNDLAQSEIAERLNIPLGTVKSRMRLAYGKLKVKLEIFK